jgi:hypothetical protein
LKASAIAPVASGRDFSLGGQIAVGDLRYFIEQLHDRKLQTVALVF